MGRGLLASEIAPAVDRIIDVYLDKKQLTETFSDTYQRIGKSVFKESIYGDEHAVQTA